MAQDVARQSPRALHVVHDHRAGIAIQHVGGEQHQQPVGVDDLALAGDHAQAVAVAVEGDAEVGIQALHHLDQVVRLCGSLGSG